MKKNIYETIKKIEKDVYFESQVCPSCNQDIQFAGTCRLKKIIYGAEEYFSVKFGNEKNYSNHKLERCIDCNVKKGGYHHSGCEMEECPKCGETLLVCKC
jgi:hypothetical protein